MAETQTKIKTALDESRMLVLGTQVLMGSEFTAVFQSSFDKLPGVSRYLVMGALALLLVALALFMSPAPYHHLAEHGRPTDRFMRYVTRVTWLALLPVALGLGINLYVATAKVITPVAGIGAGVLAGALALFFWYGLEAVEKQQHSHGKPSPPAKPPGGTSIDERVTDVLTEARVVLPGVQALIGFQFSSMFTDPFDQLPASSKYVHLGSIALMAIGMILLMTPAAYHRIVERGQNTEHFERFASRMVLAAMTPLALGISLEFFVVARKITESAPFAVAGAALVLLLFLGAWFGFTLWRRHEEDDGR